MSNRTAGFYATDDEVFYRTPAGRGWVVSTPDSDEVGESDIPDEATSVDGMLTPEEAIEYCRQIEEAGGESLLSD